MSFQEKAAEQGRGRVRSGTMRYKGRAIDRRTQRHGHGEVGASLIAGKNDSGRRMLVERNGVGGKRSGGAEPACQKRGQHRVALKPRNPKTVDPETEGTRPVDGGAGEFGRKLADEPSGIAHAACPGTCPATNSAISRRG